MAASKAEQALRKVAVKRALGEPDVPTFQPAVHPGLVLRGFLGKIPPDKIAAQIGIGLDEFDRWLRDYPEMAEARQMAVHSDAAVLTSLFQLATGWRDPLTGKRHPPNVAACIFWAKARLGMSDQVAPPAPELTPDQMTHEQLLKRARDLLRAADRADPHVIEVGDHESGDA